MIHLSNVTKQYGDHILYKNASFQIRPGDKIGLVGPNGAGKSTVFKVIVGEEGLDEGTVNIPDKTIVGYFSQDFSEMKGRSAIQEVEGGAGRISVLAKRVKELEEALQDTAENAISDDAMTKILEEYGEVQAEFEQRGGYDLNSRAREVLTGLGIKPDDQDRPVESFSGGWMMRIALAKILALNPDVLLMDEPTNHLDMESIIWLEEWLVSFKGALVMTSHDRDFMNRIVKRIAEVNHKTITSYGGNYEFYVREREIRRDQLRSAHKRQNDMLAKEEEFISRFAARASHAAQVQSRVKKLEKMDRIELPVEDQVIDFTFPPALRSGNEVVKFQNLGKVWKTPEGKQIPVFSGLTGMVKRLDKVAVVGVNGAGKSTLLKCVLGDTDPSEGTIQLGANVKVGYFSQHSLDVLRPQDTVFDTVLNRVPNASQGMVRSLLGAFLFSGDDVFKKISVLSGGEKSRVVLATILATPLNLLILDEPTNHLDMGSREVLLDNLKKFDGTIMVVSHDRRFLRELTNRVFEVSHGGLSVFEGPYTEYAETKRTHS